ncbi:MAG: methylmalonyl-CoA mutase family protein [Fluviicola sp.]
MNNLFQEFPSVNLSDWKDKILKDLKGKELSILDFHDTIEDIDFRAFYHREERTTSELTPGSFPATRGSKTQNNDWHNGALVVVDDEKKANSKALEFLMKGADMLCFAGHKDAIDWKRVLNGVQLEYIKTQFVVDSLQETKDIISIAGSARNQIAFCFDAMDIHDEALHDLMRDSQTATYVVNGYGVQRCGANTWQEIAFCLSAGHEALIKLMEAGFSIDEAAAQIHFHLGVGPNYFNEIAKFRAMRKLWSKVVNAYEPQHNCSYNCQLTAIVGHTNKSLRDPYTNLLRQTTETMSAASSADAILVLPYDLYSQRGTSELAERMALNISSLLKEESYLHHVIDPTGGSYTIEQLTEVIGQKAWEFFQSLDKDGGIHSKIVQEVFTNKVKVTASLREQAYSRGTATLIGVNKFPDPNKQEAQWSEVPGYLGMEAFVADIIVKPETV